MTDDQPILTRRDEQKLLDEANHVEPPTLAPQPASLGRPAERRPQPTSTAATFGGEAVAIIRRHPVPTLLVGAGLAYLLMRRR